MKHLKLLISTFILLLSCFAASAHDFFSGGCYFNIIDYENALVEIANAGDGFFLKPGYTGDVVIPETVVYDEVTYQVVKIGYHAFYDCDITSVRIPASIQDIDCGYWGTRSAFSNCEKLESIVVDEYNLWYDSRDNCNAIIRTETNTLIAGCKNTVIPASVTAIGRCAFDQNSNLESIEIPNSVTLVDTLAFCECTNLKNIMFSDESQLTTIGLYAFEKCSNLTSINLPAGVTLIECEAFSECCNLTSVEFSEDSQLTTIGVYAFRYCSGLTSIEIPNSVTSIGDGAFEGCTGLTSIEIPNSVTSIGDGAFEGCSNLKTVINLSNLTFSKGSSDYGYVAYYANIVINAPNVVFVGDLIFFTVDGKHTLAGYLGNETEITLPGDYNGENYAIGDNVFKNNSSITSIEIPNSITSIGNSAFAGCAGFTGITIPNSVTSIGDGAFEGCTGLTSIEIPNSVTSIGNNAFNGCTSLTDLRIEDGESTLSLGCCGDGYVLFYYCPLRALYLGRNLSYTTDYYRYSPFRNIKTLTSITIGNNVTSIGVYAFSGCTGLTSIEIPNSVTSIGDGAFEGCAGLTSVVIPSSVTSIGREAFYDCTALASITSLIPADALFAIDPYIYVFNNVDKSACTLYVPYGAKETYAATDGWNEFTNIVELEPTATEITITINQYGNATYCSPYALDFSEVEGLKAYAATGYNKATQVVTLTRLQTAEAGVGLFLKGEPSEYVVPVIEYSNDYTLNLLVGTLEATTVNSTDGEMSNYKFTIAEGDEAPMFYPFEDNTTFSAGKAYLQIPTAWLAATAQKSLSARFDDGETTDIDEVNDELKGESGKVKTIYDLSGRVVENPTSGIYIVDGKKVIIK